MPTELPEQEVIDIPDSYYQSGNVATIPEKVLKKHGYEMLLHDTIRVDNFELTSETDVRKILTIAEHFKASDIFALSGRPILIRRYGRLYALTYTNIKGIELDCFLTTI
ncbi:MAG: hypothetical protein ACRC9I_14260, partial [Acinetobacter sp.]